MKFASAWLPVIVLCLAACSGPSGSDVNSAARQQMSNGDWNTAAITLKAHLADHPSDAMSRFLLGTALAAAGNAIGAELELRKAQSLNHAADDVVPALARVMLALGQQKKLIDEFGGTALTDKSAVAGLKSALGTAHARLGNAEAADAAYQEALALSPGLLSAQLGIARLRATSGRVADALGQIDLVLAAHPAEPEAWQLKGDVLRRSENQPALALTAYRKAIDARPDFLPAHVAIVEVHLAQGDIDAAKVQFQALRKIAPNQGQTFYIEAQLAYVDRDLARARSLLQQLLVSQPDNYRVLVLQGAVGLAMNANRSAEISLSRAVRVVPEAPLARLMLAQVQLRTGQHVNALATLAPLLAASQPDTTALTLAGQAHLQAGNFAKADDLYQRAAKQSPGNPDVRTAAAAARLAKGDTQEALKELYDVAASESGDTADLMIIAAHQRRGQFAAAIKAADALIAKQPQKAMPLELAGRMHLAMNDRTAARKRFEQALAVDPQYFPAIMRLSMLDFADKNLASARSRLTQLLQVNPRHAEAQMALIDLDIEEKAPKESVANALRALIASEPSYAPARLKLVELHLAARAPKLAVSVAQDAVASVPENPDYLSALGRAQLAAGDLQQAASTYNKLVGALPNQAWPLLALADAQVAQGNVAAASNSLQRALEMAPADAEVHRRLIAMAMASKQPDKAIALARRMQRQMPRHVGGYLLEAEAEAGRNNWVAAATVLKAAVNNAPDQARPAAARLVVAYVAAGKAGEARAVTSNWLQKHPQDSAFLVESGELLLLRKDFPEAEVQLSAAAAMLPNVASVHNNLAWAMLQQQKGQAVEPAQRALKLAPGDPQMLDTYALALAANGQLDQAIQTAQDALTRKPDGHALRLTLARLYLQAKRIDEAKSELAKLEALGPTFWAMGEVKQLMASMAQK